MIVASYFAINSVAAPPQDLRSRSDGTEHLAPSTDLSKQPLLLEVQLHLVQNFHKSALPSQQCVIFVFQRFYFLKLYLITSSSSFRNPKKHIKSLEAPVVKKNTHNLPPICCLLHLFSLYGLLLSQKPEVWIVQKKENGCSYQFISTKITPFRSIKPYKP